MLLVYKYPQVYKDEHEWNPLNWIELAYIPSPKSLSITGVKTYKAQAKKKCEKLVGILRNKYNHFSAELDEKNEQLP